MRETGKHVYERDHRSSQELAKYIRCSLRILPVLQCSGLTMIYALTWITTLGNRLAIRYTIT